jgi:hypothetical protein
MDAAPVDWRPDSAFVQAGASAREARVAGAGLRWALPWPEHGGLTGLLEVSAGRWSTQVTPRGEVGKVPRDHAVQLVAMPLVRWQPQPGGSAWFVEAGLGLSWHDRSYRVERKRQRSRFNFQEEVAVGRMLGGGHALSLRLAHMSNAGLRKPNPGETWWSLRWEVAW